ncbi:MAG: hypothetical protein ACOC2U_03930 [bacterium]
MKNKLLILLVFLPTVLIGCSLFKEEERNLDPIENNNQASEDEIIEAEGIIVPKSVSLFGGGTHYLTDEDENVLYALESKVEDLSRYEESKVKVKGEKQGKNSETGQELITVITVDELESDLDEEENSEPVLFEIDDLEMTVLIPADWETEQNMNEWIFSPEEDEEVITISKYDNESSQANEIRDLVQEAENITIGGEAAYRIRNGAKMDVYLLKDEYVIQFHFEPLDDEIAERRIFLDMLTDLNWTNEENTEEVDDKEELSENPDEETLSAIDLVCGGTANKLCPAGYRCELNSTDENAVGDCVKIGEVEDIEEEECPSTLKKCPDGSFLAADPDNNCEYPQCPEPIDEEIIEDEAIISEDDSMNDQEETINEEDDKNNEEENDEIGREVRAPKDEYYTIENTYYDFALDGPSNYFWKNFGRVGDSLVFIGLSDEEMEDLDDAVITIELKNEEIDSKNVNVSSDVVEIKVPDTESGSYLIRGNQEYREVLEHIADSIKPLESLEE